MTTYPECDVPGCGMDAEPQGTFEDTLCRAHLTEAYESLAADRRHDADRDAAVEGDPWLALYEARGLA